MLSRQGSLLHIDVMIFLLLFGVNISSATDAYTAGPNVIAVLIVEGSVRHVVRNLGHAF